uniref:Uncharacterized protein n=1 Tax=Spironucleus salmonicida TaxID=348837 RepID=V6LJB1_9EUKA|eukprot:EST43791.1 Hypothetical protein SS50377_16408 [Spironucleus salmonicida]
MGIEYSAEDLDEDYIPESMRAQKIDLPIPEPSVNNFSTEFKDEIRICKQLSKQQKYASSGGLKGRHRNHRSVQEKMDQFFEGSDFQYCQNNIILNNNCQQFLKLQKTKTICRGRFYKRSSNKMIQKYYFEVKITKASQSSTECLVFNHHFHLYKLPATSNSSLLVKTL